MTFVGNNLTINRAALVITANSVNRAYGQANPTFTAAYAGFVNGDSQANLSTTLMFTTTANTASIPGMYPITVSGATSSNYNISFLPGVLTVNALGNTNLANLSVNAGTLSPAFAASTTAYTVSVSSATTTIRLTPTVADATAAITVNGIMVSSGSASSSIPLMVGNNTITTVVTAQDGTTKTYTINVNRSASAIASLADLSISSGTLLPVFASTTSNYALMVNNGIGTINVTATPSDPTARITVNGVSIVNGQSSGGITLNVGNNDIIVVVTAQDGITNQTYSIAIQRGIAPIDITASNIMTPNGDGKNDRWIVKDIALYPDNTVWVFDREGRTVYTKRGYNNDWNGTLNGAPLQQGTYYYVVDLGLGQPRLKGFITILKNR